MLTAETSGIAGDTPPPPGRHTDMTIIAMTTGTAIATRDMAIVLARRLSSMRR